MKTKTYFAAAALLAGMSSAVFADMPASAGACDGCHAANNPVNPHLCGQPEAYLVKATNDYKNGTRSDPVMGAFVAALDDAAVAEIAAYYASQSCN